MPQDNPIFSRGFREDKVVVEVYAVDVVGVNCGGGDVWVGVSFGDVDGCRIWCWDGGGSDLEIVQNRTHP
jgi:hypothetical protein